MTKDEAVRKLGLRDHAELLVVVGALACTFTNTRAETALNLLYGALIRAPTR
jgi:hypothetical protein